MQSQNGNERTETDERIAENQEAASVVPATRDLDQTQANGLPPGVSDDSRSPLDPVFYDPYQGRREEADKL